MAAENSFLYCLIMEVTMKWPGGPVLATVAPLKGGGDLGIRFGLCLWPSDTDLRVCHHVEKAK